MHPLQHRLPEPDPLFPSQGLPLRGKSLALQFLVSVDRLKHKSLPTLHVQCILQKTFIYFTYFNDLFLQRSPVRGSVRLQHPLVQRRPPVEVVCHPVVLHKLQKLSSPYELWLSLRVPPPLPPILPKKICIRHVASKKNEVTPYHCIFRFFNLSKFTSYGRISHWSTFGNLICRNLQLKMFYLLVQFSWMSYASYFKQPQSSC